MTDRPITVIHILALGHSGTTLLETLLWEHFGVLALGEVSAVLHQKKGSEQGTDDICSCGKSLQECSFWRDFDIKVHGWKPQDVYPFCKEVLAQAKARGTVAITDSSPSQFVLPAFQQLEREGLCELKVVYLTRLPQGWIPLFRRMCDHAYSGLTRVLRRSSLRVAHYWYKENLRCMALAQKLGISYLTVSYEQLALDSVTMLAAMGNFAGLSALGHPASRDMRHISYSHRTKFTTLSIKDVVYDTEWFSDRAAQLSVLVLPHVRRLANKIVPLPKAGKK